MPVFYFSVQNICFSANKTSNTNVSMPEFLFPVKVLFSMPVKFPVTVWPHKSGAFSHLSLTFSGRVSASSP